MLPKKTLSEQVHRPSGIKQNKERVSVMVCTNAGGSLKLPFVVIGKSQKPRPIKDCISSLPVHYANQSKSWMNAAIFEKWFKEEFVPKVTVFLKDEKLPVKAILLLNNAPCHPSAETFAVGDIKVLYLPPNTTAILQPCDQGIIETLKRFFRSRLSKYIFFFC